MNDSDQYINKNKEHWNELTDVHVKSKFYDVERFKKRRSTLHQLEIDEIGDVKGKSLLHLQCHFGMDTLSWARFPKFMMKDRDGWYKFKDKKIQIPLMFSLKATK